MGDYLSTPRKDIHSEISSNTKIAYVSGSMQGYRCGMEDAHNCILDLDKGVSLFAIYDGHLGCDVAVYCSKYLPEFIKKHPQFKEKNYEQCLIDSFLEFDATLKEKSVIEKMNLLKEYNIDKYGPNPVDPREDPRRIKELADAENKMREATKSGYDSGSTAVLSLVTDDRIYAANIGDSRCIASTAGKAISLSLDHKPKNKIEYERIIKAGGFVKEDRVDGNLNLSRAFGDYSFKSNPKLSNIEQKVIALPDTFTCEITSNVEFLILVCDGLVYGNLEKRNQEIVDFVRSRLIRGLELKKISDELLQEGLRVDSTRDNMSCIIVRFLSNKISPKKSGTWK